MKHTLITICLLLVFAVTALAQDAIGTGRMVGSSSNCRSGPDLRFNALTGIPRDTIVPVFDFAVDTVPGDNIEGWTQVSYEGFTCWVADFLIAVDPTPTPEVLPSVTPSATIVVTPQPSPTLAPTLTPVATSTPTETAGGEPAVCAGGVYQIFIQFSLFQVVEGG